MISFPHNQKFISWLSLGLNNNRKKFQLSQSHCAILIQTHSRHYIQGPRYKQQASYISWFKQPPPGSDCRCIPPPPPPPAITGHHHPALQSLYGNGDDGGQLPYRRRVVLLHPHEPAHDVVSIPGPAEDVCVLEPGRNVALRMTRLDRINDANRPVLSADSANMRCWVSLNDNNPEV